MAGQVVAMKGLSSVGISHNNYLDLILIAVLALIGIIIKMVFSENFSRLGNSGPAQATIWGYGLTAIALSIMIFMGIYLSNQASGSTTSMGIVSKIIANTFPIFLTLFVIMYTIYLNFSYFTKINSNRVTRDYYTYSYLSSGLIIFQLILISTYLSKYILTNTSSQTQTQNNSIEIYKSITYILCVVNFIFLLMIHVSLAFFSTDEESD
jgi:hypothetical protein